MNNSGSHGKIYTTSDYTIFKFFPENRPISKKHVRSLAEDSTFSSNFINSTIEVTPDHYIIDGQHRFIAAKQLGIPIHYQICYSDPFLQIKNRNVNQKRWKFDDYINFYANANESYLFLKEIRSYFGVSFTFICAAVMKISSISCRQFDGILKNGNLNILKFKNEIKEFLDIYISSIKQIEKSKGEKEGRPLFLSCYISAFCELYLLNKKDFIKAIENTKRFSWEIPYARDVERARENVTVFIKWNPSKEKKK